MAGKEVTFELTPMDGKVPPVKHVIAREWRPCCLSLELEKEEGARLCMFLQVMVRVGIYSKCSRKSFIQTSEVI